jgi:GNAT superfamily N-acetyltransferase
MTVGFALWFLFFGTFSGRYGLWVANLYVEEPYRGIGIGLALFRHMARIAVEKLRDQVSSMRQLRGPNVVPAVELANAPMKTRLGDRLRPAFVIKGWVAFGAESGVARIDDKSTPAGVTPVTPPTMAEWLSDEIPFD